MSDDSGTDDPGKRQAEQAGAKIVDLSVVAPVSADRVVSAIRSYWDSLRRGRAVPERTDVEASGIRTVLDFAFILERIAPGAARFRLSGRHLIDLMGMEVRGMPVCSFLNPDSRGRLSDVLETVFKGPQIADIALHSRAAYGRPELRGRMLFLPLRSDLGDVTRALGCLVSEGTIGRGPRRFDILTETVFPVIEGAAPLPPASDGVAEPPPSWQAPILRRPVLKPLDRNATPEDRRARFRLIESTSD
ncbi:PAS domain-containing protein [Paracoccus albus]|uniref:PAS domain-containing protein n=1 Tax=Paracoccus albus TaxID=3017784 RepID=UPI0022F127F4|nr:PAS domain-containing protein [Paracoccus albus]WBU61366.1 PAS domain-containing protein [Paracoccus albus]